MTQAPERLAAAGLTLWDAIAQSVGFMGPVLSLALITSLVASGAGGATPLAMLLAALGMLGLGWVISQFATRIARAGSLYDYVTDAFGPRVGFIAGWIYYGGVLCLAIAVIEVIGGISSDFLAAQFGIKIHWLISDFIYAALVFAALYRGIKLSTRVQLILVAISVASVLLFCLSLVARGGASGNSLAAFSPSSVGGGSGLLLGLLFAILIFVGFESAANLAEETANPKRNIPLAILLSLSVIGAYQVFGTYAMDIGYGIDNAAKQWAVDPTPFLTLGNKYANGAVASYLQVVVIMDIAAVGLATAVSATRGIFALARDRRLPPVLARVSSRGTPVGAITLYVAVALVISVITAIGGGIFPLNGAPIYLPMFIELAGIGSLALVIVYTMVCVGGIRALRGHTNAALLWVAGIVGAVINLLAIYGIFFPSGTLLAFPPYPGTVPDIFVVAWAVVGVILALVRSAQMTREAPSTG